MQQSGVQMDILFLSYKNVAGSATYWYKTRVL